MQLITSRPGSLQRALAVFRFLTLGLATSAVLLGDRAPDPRLALVGGGYLAFSGLVWLLGPRLDRAWVAYPLALVDTAAITGLLALSPATGLPPWTLYLFPLAAAAAVGRLPAAVAAGLSVAGLLAGTQLALGTVPVSVLWAVALIVATALVAATLPSRWLAEQRERHVLAEVAAARELLRCEHVLRQAAAALAGTLERRVVQDALVAAARSGLGAAAGVVDRASGRVVAGDALTEATARPGGDRETPSRAADADVVVMPPWTGTRVVPVGDGLDLVVQSTAGQLGRTQATWLEELAALARSALGRCDEHERLRAEHERLRAEHERLRASLEATPAPLALWDAGGTLVLANAAHRALGLQDESPEDLPPTGVHEVEVSLGEPPRTFVVATLRVADGEYLLSLYREITREREALRAKDELISMAGHELRNPLSAIRGYSQIMARHLGVVQQQVDQLNQLIGDFVDAARLEGGQLPLTRERLDLAALARAAAARFRGAYEGRSLRLELGDVPPVEGDPSRLGQVLDNLLGNAAKYSPADAEIVLAAEAAGREVLLSVRDRGIGIAPEHLPHLFERFYRAPGADTERVKGSGLGLSVVHDLVAAHGGRIWAESAREGQGSTFWVALPVASEAESEESGVTAAESSTREKAGTGGRR